VGGSVNGNGLIAEVRGKCALLANKVVVAPKGQGPGCMVAEAGTGGHIVWGEEKLFKATFVEDDRSILYIEDSL